MGNYLLNWMILQDSLPFPRMGPMGPMGPCDEDPRQEHEEWVQQREQDAQ